MTSTDLCPFGCGVSEIVDHVFRGCSTANNLWRTLQVNTNAHSLSMDVCLKLNMHRGQNITFYFALWHLWKWCCKGVFEEGFVVPPIVAQLVLQFVSKWVVSNPPVNRNNHGINKVVRWIKPQLGEYKLNTDACRRSDSEIAAGGVIHDQ